MSGKTNRWYTIIRYIIAFWITGVLIAGFLVEIPYIKLLEHTARNLFFHVPMWFTMTVAFLVSAYHSARVLTTGKLIHDIRAEQAAIVGSVFGLLGLVTGMIWARFTWYLGTNLWWNFDPKQTMAAVQLLIYGAYFVLRSSIPESRRRAKIAAAYNLFAVVTLPFLLFVLPRQMKSLHPGAEGNPAFDDITAPEMRLVFYPALIGFIGLFWWIYTQRVRMRMLECQLEEVLPTETR